MRVRHLLVAGSLALLALGSWAVSKGSDLAAQTTRLGAAQAQTVRALNEAHGLLALGGDYLLHASDRAARQWALRYDQLRGDLQDPVEAPRDTRTTFPHLRDMHAQLSTLFAQFRTAGASGATESSAQREMLADEMVATMQRISDGLYEIARALDEDRVASEQRWQRFARNASLGLLLLIAGLAVLIDRRLLVPLARLQRTTRAVSAGNLAVLIDARTHDEVGDLGRDFNAMTAALRSRTAALESSEHQLRVMTERLPAMVAFVGGDGRYRFVSGQYERTFKRPASRIVGLTVEELIGPANYVHVQPKVAAALRGEPVRFECSVQAADGQVELLMEYIPVAAAGGSFNGFYAMGIDISERKAAERARRSLEAQLGEAQKMESIGTLAGGIAHDFNNILGSILGNVALATTELPPDSPAQASLLQILQASHRARDLVHQILSFSRRDVLQRSVQDVAKIAEESRALLRAAIPAGIDMVLRLDTAPMFVNVDAGQVQQVLMNLGVNAWHAIEGPHGRIEMAASRRQVGEGGVEGQPMLTPGTYVQLSVSDTGSGMDEAVRARIFEPFFTTKPVGKGTGLGLAVVHGIVKAHEGAITVESRLGEGSAFHIWLPLAEAPPVAALPSAPRVLQRNGRGEMIAFVDDDELMRLMAHRLLEIKGYSPRCFESAEAALLALRTESKLPDLVITDFNMPGTNGLELAQAIAALAPGLPVIISSGYIEEALLDDARQAGVRAVLHKETLLDTLGPELLRALRSSAEAPTGAIARPAAQEARH